MVIFYLVIVKGVNVGKDVCVVGFVKVMVGKLLVCVNLIIVMLFNKLLGL